MNSTSRRFLALNCALNGHNFLEAFDNNVELAAKCLGTTKENITSLEKKYAEQLGKPSSKQLFNPGVLSLLNFFRCSEYAFVSFPGAPPISVREFVESDRQGEVSKEVRNALLTNIVRDIAFVPSMEDSRISDGIFYVKGCSDTDLFGMISGAYMTYCFGPRTKQGYNTAVLDARNRVNLAYFRGLPASTCLGLLNDCLSQNLNPTIYRDTCLLIPDLLPVYRQTGAILAMPIDEADREGIRWLMDIKGTENAKAVKVPSSMVRSFINDSPRDLANIVYDSSVGKDGALVRVKG